MRWGGRRKTAALSDKEGGENVSLMVFSFLPHRSSEVRQTRAGGPGLRGLCSGVPPSSPAGMVGHEAPPGTCSKVSMCICFRLILELFLQLFIIMYCIDTTEYTLIHNSKIGKYTPSG